MGKMMISVMIVIKCVEKCIWVGSLCWLLICDIVVSFVVVIVISYSCGVSVSIVMI